MQYQLLQDHLSLDVSTGDRSELETALHTLLAHGATATSIDLVGLANQDKLLELGGWTLDGATRKTRSLFRGLADQRVFERLGAGRLCLYGCMTATTPRGRHTLDVLADLLQLEVTGTTDLVCAPAATTSRTPSNRLLDLDALPARPSLPHQRIATVAEAHQLLQLVHRTAGVELPGLLASPHHAIALPSYVANAYHHVEMLLDFEYVRVAGDLVFPVDDPRALRSLADA